MFIEPFKGKKVFVTSDSHFGHENIINLANRPFRNVAHMDTELVKNWNNVVGPEDIVVHNGDFTWYNVDKAQAIFDLLNGRKFLICGNHDKPAFKLRGWLDVFTSSYFELLHENQNYVMCHYPIEDWNGMYRQKSVHLYGHTHQTLMTPHPNKYNICVEHTNYTPVDITTYKNKKEAT